MKNEKDLKENISLHAMIVLRKALKTIDGKVMTDIRETGLTPTQFGVLEVIYSKGSLKVGQLIEKMLSTSGNITVVIKNMEKKNLIKKIPDRNDKRSFVVDLTEKGRKIIEELLPLHITSIEEAFRVLTDEDKRDLINILKKFKKIDEDREKNKQQKIMEDKMSKKILFIVGSLRKGSFNKSLAEYVEKLIGDKAEVEYLDYSNIPYMNQNIEFPVPAEIAAVREKATEADGIWIFTPEYNYAVPGVLKNLLDWLSRPLVQYDFRGPSAIHEKKVTISGAAGGSAAKNARKQLAYLAPFIRMNLIGGEGTGVSMPPESFSTDEFVINEESEKALKAQVEEFLKAL